MKRIFSILLVVVSLVSCEKEEMTVYCFKVCSVTTDMVDFYRNKPGEFGNLNNPFVDMFCHGEYTANPDTAVIIQKALDNLTPKLRAKVNPSSLKIVGYTFNGGLGSYRLRGQKWFSAMSYGSHDVCYDASELSPEDIISIRQELIDAVIRNTATDTLFVLESIKYGNNYLIYEK